MNLTISVLTRFNTMKIALFTLFIMSNIAIANAATLTSTVNRNTINTNETLTLTVTSDQQVDSSALDLSTLNNDFEILGVVPLNSSSVSDINGQTKRISSTQWTINLAAKREGELQIPAFVINNNRSQAITIKALTPENFKNTSTSQSAPLIAIGLAQKISIYPGEQLIYNIELSAAANVRDLSGNALEVAGASTEVIDQQQFQRIENGVARTVVILKYAIFPQESGQITIPSVTFAGLIGGQRSFFGNQGQRVVGRTKALTVEVKPKPTQSNSTWFPAEKVSIASSWSGDLNSLQTGSPITRTVTVKAQGQLANVIPPLEQALANNTSVKSYKDKPQLDSQKTTNGFISTRIESEALVANAAGEIKLPAITVDWFNVNTQAWEQATLESETLSVSGKAVSQNSSANPTSIVNTSITSNEVNTSSTHWAWPIATALLGLICLIQSLLLFRNKAASKQEPKKIDYTASENELWKILSNDLKSDDVNKVRFSIINWARAAHPKQRLISLATLAQQVEPNLARLFNKVEASLFANEATSSLDGLNIELKKELQAYRKHLFSQKNANNKEDTNSNLAPLYSNS